MLFSIFMLTFNVVIFISAIECLYHIMCTLCVCTAHCAALCCVAHDCVRCPHRKRSCQVGGGMSHGCTAALLDSRMNMADWLNSGMSPGKKRSSDSNNLR